MSGLLGSLVAGAIGGYTGSRIKTLENQEAFEFKKALLDAEVDKAVQLKRLGYEMDDEREAKQAEQMREYMKPTVTETTTPESVLNRWTDADGVEQETKSGGETFSKETPTSIREAAQKALLDGRPGIAESLLKFDNKPTFKYEKMKINGADAIVAINEMTGESRISLQGEKEEPQYKSFEEAILASKDPKEQAALMKKAKEIAVAKRAPVRESDDDQTYDDWKNRPENKGKGRSAYAEWKANLKTNDNTETVTTEPVWDGRRPVLDKDGNQVTKERVTTKRQAGSKPEQQDKIMPWQKKW